MNKLILLAAILLTSCGADSTVYDFNPEYDLSSGVTTRLVLDTPEEIAKVTDKQAYTRVYHSTRVCEIHMPDHHGYPDDEWWWLLGHEEGHCYYGAWHK